MQETPEWKPGSSGTLRDSLTAVCWQTAGKVKIKLSAALGENLPDTFLDVGSTPTVSTIWSTCTIWTLAVLSAGAFIVFSIGWRFFAFGRASKFVQIFDQKCRKVAIRTRDINSYLSLVYRRYSIRLQTGPVSYSAASCEVYPRYRISCIPR